MNDVTQVIDDFLPSIRTNCKKLVPYQLISYKDLCEVLNQPYYKGGNQKKRQLKEFERYFDFENKDRKILIKEVYDSPKEIEYKYPVNAIYAECIEKILLTFLSEQEDDVAYISSKYLYLTLGMVNRDYINMMRPDLKDQLRQDLRNEYKWGEKDIEDKSINFYINNFYSRSKSKLSSIIDSSLKSLQRQRLVESSHVYHMYFATTDKKGRTIELYDKYSNDSETTQIMSIERKVLDEFGYKNESDIWLHNKSDEYYEKITNIAKGIFPDLKSLYRCYKFIYTRRDIKNALNKEEKREKQLELNDKVLNFIDNQAKKNYLSNLNLSQEEREITYNENYEQAQYYLSNRFIKLNE